MEDVTIAVIEKLKTAESKDQMFDIVNQKLHKLIKKFEDRIFTSSKPTQEYRRDKDIKDEIIFIKDCLEGNWNDVANERYRFLKLQVETALNSQHANRNFS